jgi:hypothetical protein
MVSQSLTQLQAKTYAQQCCSVWRHRNTQKSPPDESGGQK